MSYGALGLVEVLGSCNAVVVLDQMLKTSDVEFRTWHTKCGGHQKKHRDWWKKRKRNIINDFQTRSGV